MTKLTARNLYKLIAELTPGQQRVAFALIRGEGNTYPGVAEALNLSVGTIYTHLKRVRDKHPGTYAALMAYREGQLEHRHVEALRKARAHSDKWFRRKRNREFYYRRGYWPWE